MSRSERLSLDQVISSVPELGPTISDGGYSWIILIGTMAVQVMRTKFEKLFENKFIYSIDDSTKYCGNVWCCIGTFIN